MLGLRKGLWLSILLTGVLVPVGGGLGTWLFDQGFVRCNHPSDSRFPVRGLDVSHHQGAIDWPAVARQTEERADFVYIKATEGRSWIDPHFADNWRGTRRAGLLHGAYHFFGFCASGIEQAEHFLRTVPANDPQLPLAVDVEPTGNCKRPWPLAAVRTELWTMLRHLERARSRKPILYVTEESYEVVVSGHFDDYPIWIRNVFFEPRLLKARSWSLWQFANRGRVPGIPKPVDLDVYAGGRISLGGWVARPRPDP